MSCAAIYRHTSMANVIYSMSSSLDGYIAGPDGDFSWTPPDAELHAFHNERVRKLSAHLLGRRLYETMVYWEREDDGRDAVARELLGERAGRCRRSSSRPR